MTPPDILIVDDLAENLRLLARMLADQGYKARPVPSGALALKAVARIVPDLVLLDINMPEMDGYEVCERLKDDPRTRDVPVIFISALNETVDKVRAFEIGGVDYITKPFQFEEVEARVRTHLAIARLKREVDAKNAKLEASLARQRELEETKDKLVQMIVHDMKNPLGAILANAAMLEDDLAGMGDLGEIVGDVLDSGQQMHRMVLNILDAMRDRDLKLHRVAVELGHLVAGALRTIRPAAEKAGRQLETRVEGDEFRLDRDVMQRVIENLVENSIKYAPAGGIIEVRARVDDEGLHLCVSDNGPGVPVAMRERVFDLYTRLERHERHEARVSRGLGLAYCRMAVEAHGGKIWITDNEPTGARFEMLIPVEVGDPAES